MKVKIITGSPCSGKSTYCKNAMSNNDIVYDYDQLTRALRYEDKHRAKNELTHQYVIDFRFAILKRLKIDNQVDTVYFISSKKLTDGFLNFLDGIDYEIIEMETSKEECLKRLENDDTRPDKKTWKEKIEKWFEENGEVMKKGIPNDKLANRQFRKMATLEAEKNTDYIVTSYAMKYEPYLLYSEKDGDVYEEFRKEAFEKTNVSDIIMLYDHQGRVFARTSNNTLKVTFDKVGMLIEADLSSNEASKSLYDDIKSGLITKMSWSFKTGDYHFDKETRTIVHEKIDKIYDVSAVGIPANNDTYINAREFSNGVIAEFEAERLQEQRKKQKILIKLKMEEF